MATQLNNWLSIDKTSGTGNAEITLTASSYEELVDRTTSLKIQGISANAILNVRQNALVPQIEIEGDLVFPSYGGERTISIKSNIGWRIENGDWYNFSITQGSANKKISTTITVDSNGGDERRAEIPIYKNDSNIIIGYITLTQNNANLTVEVPTDVENCFYIEPTVTDGRVIDIQFGFEGSVTDNYDRSSYIFYYEDSTWKMFKPATAWNEFPILKIQKRVYFKEFYRRNTYNRWYLKFNITGDVNVGGDLSTLLGDVENPYGYNTTNARDADFLFKDCPIVNASQLVLPTKMYDSAYSNMFQNCSKLIAAPKLPATTLATYCYTYMFGGCTSLTTAPELPATDLEHACYAHMFDNCSKLENAPLLPARILKDRCYVYMFFNCVKLSHIEMLGLVMGDGSLGNWVTGVNASGTFVKADNVTLETGNNGIPDGWSITESVYSPTVEELKSSYLWVEFENEGGYVGDFYSGIVYSFDGINWIQRTNYPFGVNMRTNKIIYLGSTSSSLSENTGAYYSITFSSGKAKMGGELTKIGRRDKYTNVFGYNEGLTDASKLILPTKLSEGCFENLFRDCTSLVNPPQLPATVLANGCYSGMFYGCTSLTTAPELPATTLADGCYGSMFYGCTSLVNPPQLPATVLANGCYSNMFVECFSLVAAPQLPATTLAENCYNGMFRDCKSLTTAPILPATTLVPYCYSSMFIRCKNLETAPDLLAYTVPERAYDFMFNECTKLNYIKMLGVDISKTGLSSWVYQVQTTEGTFVKHPDAKLSTGESGIPKNWTVETATS